MKIELFSELKRDTQLLVIRSVWEEAYSRLAIPESGRLDLDSPAGIAALGVEFDAFKVHLANNTASEVVDGFRSIVTEVSKIVAQEKSYPKWNMGIISAYVRKGWIKVGERPSNPLLAAAESEREKRARAEAEKWAAEWEGEPVEVAAIQVPKYINATNSMGSAVIAPLCMKSNEQGHKFIKYMISRLDGAGQMSGVTKAAYSTWAAKMRAKGVPDTAFTKDGCKVRPDDVVLNMNRLNRFRSETFPKYNYEFITKLLFAYKNCFLQKK